MNMESQEAVVKSLILSTNLFLEMDVSSDEEENESTFFENYDDNSNAHHTSTAAVAALQIPRWSGYEYQMYLKLSAETFEFLYQLIGPRLRRICYGMPMVEAHLQLMVAIHKLTSLKTYSDASEMFNLKKSTGYCCTNRVTSALHDLSPAFIKWPSPSAAKKILESFQEMSGFPGIIGDLGQYRFNVLYLTEKDDNSGILLQAICDHTRKFTHCHIASSNSETSEWLNNYLEDATLFPNNTHLISTSSYPLHESLMVPYYEEDTVIQKNFNKKLLSASVIDECLSNLLGRFESLQRALSLKKTNRTHIVACCVLHNICELKGDKYAGEKNKIEKVRHGCVPCSPKAKVKRDAIAAKLPND